MEPDPTSQVAAAAAGDRDAWDAIVARYADLVWAVARSFRLGSADAADVSQTTWLRLVEHLGDVRDPSALGSWLATTARREALALLRRRREVPLPDDDRVDLVDGRPDAIPGQALLDSERDRELWRAFQVLQPRCQTLLRLLVIEPLDSYAAASTALGVPIGSLGPTRARCLAALRQQLRAYVGEEGGGE
jgi:RNA polymerase sigma factor (sigma-70 family)